MNRRALAIALLVVAAAWPLALEAQQIEHGRGKIISIDQGNLTVQLQDPKGRIATWRFASDATVTFTDGTDFYRNPSVHDLRPPMYAHFSFSDSIIQTFNVVELGFDPSQTTRSSGGDSGGHSSRRQEGVPRTVTGRVYAYDAGARQVALDHSGTRETFQLTSRSDQRLNQGDRVELRTTWSGARELVTELRVLGTGSGDRDTNRDDRYDRGDDRRDDRRDRRTTRGRSSRNEGTEGRVVRVSSRGVVIDVDGDEQTYRVSDSRLLRDLRTGDTVRFEWEERDGRLYITEVY